MLRPLRLLPVLAVVAAAGVALLAPGSASARVTPLGQQLRVVVVDHIPDAAFATLARRGAVGLLRPGAGETTSRRLAMAELVRGHQVKPGHPGVPHIAADTEPFARVANCRMCVVLELPAARGRSVGNDKLYRIAVIGKGYHGILTSPRTRIPGLLSVYDIVATVLPGHQTTALSWTPAKHAIQTLASLNQQIGANDRLKLPSLFILAGLVLLLAFFGLRAAVTAVPAALLMNLLLGVTQVSNEVLLVFAIAGGTALLAFLLARVCRTDDSLLLLFGGVAALYAAAMAVRPEWQAINPFGPTQNQRYWGIGNQVETLLLVPFLAGAVIAQRRFGIVGFALFGAFGLVVLTDNRLGADGGGAITLGIALAVLGWRLFRLRLGGLVSLLVSAACLVLWVVSRGLAQPGQNHLRGAFSGNGMGFLHVLASLVPLSYVPALQRWPIVLPLLIACAAIFVVGWRRTSNRSTRDLLLALGIALLTSLLVNDSAAYVLAGGIAVLAAATRFMPTAAPARLRVRVPVLRRARLAAQPVVSKSPPR